MELEVQPSLSIIDKLTNNISFVSLPAKSQNQNLWKWPHVVSKVSGMIHILCCFICQSAQDFSYFVKRFDINVWFFWTLSFQAQNNY